MTNPDLSGMNETTTSIYDLIVIGAGISGLTAGKMAQKAGLSVLVLDKGRRIGGRCATRRSDGFTFNHGAQFFTARDPGFQAVIDDARQKGNVDLWQFGHDKPCYIGTPTMRDFASFLGDELEIEQSVEITNITKSDRLYKLTSQAGDDYHCHKLLITAPAPQAQKLVQPVSQILAHTAASASYAPCWTVMAGYQTVTTIPEQVVRDKAPIGWAMFEQSRFAGKNDNDQPLNTIAALTCQADATTSIQMLEWSKDDVIEALLSAYKAATGWDETPTYQTAHRWLYAKIMTPASQDAPYHDDDGHLVLAGDWFGSARLETAYLSGRRAGAMVTNS